MSEKEDALIPTFLQGPEVHKKAFHVYYRTRNFKAVEKAVGVAYQTVHRWATGDFRCRWGCQWHDWENLIDNKEKALNAKIDLINKGNFDPARHELAMQQAVDGEVSEKTPAIDDLIRSDLERIGHYEYLYAKIYKHLTGISLTMDNMLDPSELQADDLKRLAETYDKGLPIVNFEVGLRCLNDTYNKIQELKVKAGIVPQQAQSQQGVTTLKIEDLRKLKLALNTMPSSQVSKLLTSNTVESKEAI